MSTKDGFATRGRKLLTITTKHNRMYISISYLQLTKILRIAQRQWTGLEPRRTCYRWYSVFHSKQVFLYQELLARWMEGWKAGKLKSRNLRRVRKSQKVNPFGWTWNMTSMRCSDFFSGWKRRFDFWFSKSLIHGVPLFAYLILMALVFLSADSSCFQFLWLQTFSLSQVFSEVVHYEFLKTFDSFELYGVGMGKERWRREIGIFFFLCWFLFLK